MKKIKALSPECLFSFPYISAVPVRIPHKIRAGEGEQMELRPLSFLSGERENAEEKLEGAGRAQESTFTALI